eukprot:TRINITY_DN12190_c0_g1_i1.p1 TRINITY_DN12190_c0_g1~~TRINITY_DN12190_c0_g1_i1.p1  ORF type:complete len:455 (+),score=78.28 TRINITY_DN12190_c0_g1_i1:194-1558(+)
MAAITTPVETLGLSWLRVPRRDCFLTEIHLGGGPRTFPGGVTKWQWKRLQQKKHKKILKARLQRERQIYEMRKRAELIASSKSLQKPWEEHPQSDEFPILSAASADEQIRSLADRFRKHGAIDLWNENDGPQGTDRSPSAAPLFTSREEALLLNENYSKSVKNASKAGSPSAPRESALPRILERMNNSSHRKENSDFSEDGNKHFNRMHGFQKTEVKEQVAPYRSRFSRNFSQNTGMDEDYGHSSAEPDSSLGVKRNQNDSSLPTTDFQRCSKDFEQSVSKPSARVKNDNRNQNYGVGGSFDESGSGSVFLSRSSNNPSNSYRDEGQEEDSDRGMDSYNRAGVASDEDSSASLDGTSGVRMSSSHNILRNAPQNRAGVASDMDSSANVSAKNMQNAFQRSAKSWTRNGVEKFAGFDLGRRQSAQRSRDSALQSDVSLETNVDSSSPLSGNESAS